VAQVEGGAAWEPALPGALPGERPGGEHHDGGQVAREVVEAGGVGFALGGEDVERLRVPDDDRADEDARFQRLPLAGSDVPELHGGDDAAAADESRARPREPDLRALAADVDTCVERLESLERNSLARGEALDALAEGAVQLCERLQFFPGG
jgi:hypothetical protein